MGMGGGPVATWTVVFTDVVASTEHRVRVGEARFDELRADLQRRLAPILDEHGAAVVKSTGDGLMLGFAATAAALQCAVAIQRAVAERNADGLDAIDLRVGISVGDAVREGDDLHGTAVVEAARLCAIATRGSILCSGAVRTVSANRSGCSFGEGRSVALKGLPGPVVAYEVHWQGPTSDGRGELAFGVLGPFTVERRGGPVAVGGPKERVVLAALLVHANEVVSVEALIDSVWGDHPPRTAERTLHAYVARLRKALDPGRSGPDGGVLETVGRGYRLRVARGQIDAGRFEEAVRAGAEAVREGRPVGGMLAAALAEWRGAAYGEFADVPACAAEASRLGELRLVALEQRIDADLAEGADAELVAEIEATLREHPFRERLWGQLVLALYRAGRQRDALDAYQRARTVLVEELGIEPGPELRRLEAAVLAQDTSLDRAGRARTAGPAGFPLLLDAVGPAFVGREREAGWLRDAWSEAADGRGSFVSVLGPEGIGKTRLIAEVAREAHDAGAAVLYGRCDHAHVGARSLVDLALRSGGGSAADLDDDGAGAGGLAAALGRHLPTWAGGRPVLLVFDDLHLADGETLEFVADLAGWCRAATLLVVGTFRSDAGAGSDGTSQLELGPLSADGVAGICRLYEPEGWTVEDVREVAELTGGVPLAIHERASAWARDRTSRRLERAAEQLAASRGRLNVSRDELAAGVEGIQRLLEQRRLQLAGREAQVRSDQVAALAACPYKGLARFEQADAANFFGRERLVAELVARLAEVSFLAVVGPSGSGKSSLVRAGLLPALAAGVLADREPWDVVALCPGRRPSDELARRLQDAGGSTPLAVFVDQFEEAFTLCTDDDDRRGFVESLVELAARPRTAVILAVRADHLGRCASYPDLADLLAGNDVLVGPMRDPELRRTIELPAQRAGLSIEAGLVDLIIGDVAGRAGCLPLLSTALAETWERREQRRLTVAGYRAAGGVNGALARLAEDAYGAIPDAARPAARRFLLRLCDPGESGAVDVRRRLPLDEVVDPADGEARLALDILADTRLLTIDDDAVEISHEALLREWPRLRAWLEEDVQGRQLHRRLAAAAHAWDDAGRDPSELYRGSRLVAATEWAAGDPAALNALEREFLDASQEAEAWERIRVAAQAAERERTNRRLRRSLRVAAVLLLAAVAAGLVAYQQRERADEQAAEARFRGLLAQVDSVGRARRDLAALLAVAAYQIEPGPASFDALLGVFTREPSFRSTTPISVPDALTGFVLPGAGEVALTDSRLGVSLVDTVDGRVTATLPPILDDDGFGWVASSADGRVLAVMGTSGDGSELALWDLATGTRRFPDLDGLPVFGAVAVNGDGSLVALAGGDVGAAEVRSGSDGSLVASFDGLERPADALTRVNTAAVAFLPDGSLAIGSLHGAVRIVDPRTGRQLRLLDGPPESSVAGLVLDQAGSRLFALGTRALAAWDLTSGSLLWSTASAAACDGVVVADALGKLLCGRPDGQVTSYDLESGARAEAALDQQGGGILAMGVTSDRHQLVQVGPTAITRWGLDGAGAISHVVPLDAGRRLQELDGWGRLLVADVGELPFDPDILDPATGQVVDPLDGILGATPGYEADVLGVFLGDGSVGAYDLDTRESVYLGPRLDFDILAATGVRPGFLLRNGDAFQMVDGNRFIEPAAEVPSGIRNLTISADGTRLFTLEQDRLVQRSVETGEPTEHAPIDGVAEAATTSEHVVVATHSGRLQVRDAATLELVGSEFAGVHGAVEFIAFARDEQRMLVINAGRTLQLADLPTRSFLGDPIDMGPDLSGLEALRPNAWAVLSRDGDRLAYEIAGGILVWELAPEVLVAAACEIAGRELTPTEWDQYVGELASYRHLCEAADT